MEIDWPNVVLETPRATTHVLRLRAHVDPYLGYGRHAGALVRGFQRAGFGVQLIPMRTAIVPEDLKSAVVPQFTELPELLLDTCNSDGTGGYWYTMNETTRLPDTAFRRLRGAAHVIVPSTWNADCFSAQGLRRPIHVCPLGVDTEVFRPAPFPHKCVFGLLGTPGYSVAERKNFELAVRAFSLAFSAVDDVALKIKQTPQCPAIGVSDGRIRVDTRILSDAELVAWYRSISVLVVPSRAEAWCLPALEAMACGRPVIAAFYGGLSDFADESNAFPVEYRMVTAGASYHHSGMWAEPDIDSLVTQMRYAYQHATELDARAVRARRTAERFTWKRSCGILHDVLVSTGYFEKPKPAAVPVTFEIGTEKRRVGVDYVVNFYADKTSEKPPYLGTLDCESTTLTNTPTGLGDAVMLTDLERAATVSGQIAATWLSCQHFADLNRFNPFHRDLQYPHMVSLSALQATYDLGPGHNFQRIRRLFGLSASAYPAGCLSVPGTAPSNRVSVHLVPGGHVKSQGVYHPRPREVYPENLAILRQFVRGHPELSFFEIGSDYLSDAMPSLTGCPMDQVVRAMAACCLHIGIISGPYHVANALGVRTIAIINFPDPRELVLPVVRNIDVVEAEWLYPQSHVLHQDVDSAHWPKFSALTLEQAYYMETYPYDDPTPFLQLVSA